VSITYRALTAEDELTEEIRRGIPREVISGGVVGVDEWGGVVALVGFVQFVLLDPISIRTDHRHSAKILKHLWDAAKSEAKHHDIKAFTGLANAPLIDKLLKRVGGKHIEGRLYVIPLNEAE
jgi:hypothetical protein